MIKSIAYPIAKYVDYYTNQSVREAIKTLDFGENASLHQMTELRLNAFLSLLNHAYNTVPYYQKLFQKHNLKLSDFSTLDDIRKLPILTKEDIRSAGHSLQSTDINNMKYIIARSGGTTGEPIASYVNKKAQALGTYAYLRGLEWMGWKPGIPIVTLFGGSLHRPEKKSVRIKIREIALGTKFLPAFELTKQNARRYLDTISKYSPCVIKGYASSIYNLALYTQEMNITNIRILNVFSTAENLPEQWANKISEVFNCPVKSYYGCGEINSLGFQVEQSGPYIVPDEHVIIESQNLTLNGVLHNNNLLVTSLFNYAQPLIRYQLGDIGEVAASGIVHPTRSAITNLIGRTSDFFLRKDGSTVSPSLAPHIISKTRLPVTKYQFIQTDLNNIQFLYDLEGPDLTDHQKNEVKSIIHAHISANINLKFIRTNEFVLSKNGKYRIVISNLL